MRVVRYSNPDNTHSQLIHYLDDLLTHFPEEERPAHPVRTTSVREVAQIPSANELARKPTEEIRQLLNGHANALLAESSSSAYTAYRMFCAEYDNAIHNAWYTSTQSGRNDLLGYKLVAERKKGGFGRIFEALDSNGTRVALKVLRMEYRSEDDFIQSFRRGVRSMRILEQRGVDGVIAYRDAAEIPAFVVMEWIDGPNLAEAKEARLIDGWSQILRVASTLTRIVRAAHAVPERVLHRDLRPGNIMLKDGWSDHEGAEIVVLDFDLSWHLGASEVSVAVPGTGYHAPEQLMADKDRQRLKVSTRHAAVDAFGLGMTLYFLITGRDPVPNQQRWTNWQETIETAAAAIVCRAWMSLPRRFARLVHNCTNDEQGLRLDVAQIDAELSRLARALARSTAVLDADLLAEELAARTDAMHDYRWDDDRLVASVRRSTGLQIEVAAVESSRALAFSLHRPATDADDRRTFPNRMLAALRTASEVLTSSGWEITFSPRPGGDARLTARIPVDSVRTDPQRIAEGLDRALRTVRFD